MGERVYFHGVTVTQRRLVNSLKKPSDPLLGSSIIREGKRVRRESRIESNERRVDVKNSEEE